MSCCRGTIKSEKTLTERHREPHLHHNRQANNLTVRFEIAKRIRFGHPGRLQIRHARHKPVSSDNTPGGYIPCRSDPHLSKQAEAQQPLVADYPCCRLTGEPLVHIHGIAPGCPMTKLKRGIELGQFKIVVFGQRFVDIEEVRAPFV